MTEAAFATLTDVIVCAVPTHQAWFRDQKVEQRRSLASLKSLNPETVHLYLYQEFGLDSEGNHGELPGCRWGGKQANGLRLTGALAWAQPGPSDAFTRVLRLRSSNIRNLVIRSLSFLQSFNPLFSFSFQMKVTAENISQFQC